MFEYKRADRQTYLAAAWCCFRHAVSGWTLFVSSAVTDLVRMLLDAVILFVMAMYVSPGLGELVPLAGGYATFVVVGFLVAGLVDSLLKTFYNTVASGYWSSQFEFYGAFPRGISAYLCGAASFYLGVALIRFLFVLAVGLVVFGVRLDWANSGPAIVVLLVGVLPVIGLGLAAASTFYLLDSRAWNDPVSWAVHIAASLLAGVYFPSEILPSVLRAIGTALPHYHLLSALRLVLIDGQGLSHPTVSGSIAVLLGMAVVFIPVGVLLFRAGMSRAERMGALTRWT